ncbi:MAG: hypothetical protein LBI26_03525 [Holosporales bacterium]|nr:hypothetical protein [Holosporales bacterium]
MTKISIFYSINNEYKATEEISLVKIYEKRMEKRFWSNDEEFRTISGVFYNGTSLIHDPICCNMFDMCNSLKIGKPIVQRVFHCDWSFYQLTTNICNIESLTVLETIIKGHKSFDIFIKIYKTYGTKPNFMLDTDKILVDTSPYILTKS